MVLVHTWAVGCRVFCFGFASVKDASDLSRCSNVAMLVQVSKVFWNPPSVDDDGLCIIRAVEMSIERSENREALLSSEISSFNLHLALMIENSPNRHWLHRPLIFELVQVLAIPNMLAFIRRSDVRGLLGQKLDASLSFPILFVCFPALVFGSLVHENLKQNISKLELAYQVWGLLLQCKKSSLRTYL